VNALHNVAVMAQHYYIRIRILLLLPLPPLDSGVVIPGRQVIRFLRNQLPAVVRQSAEILHGGSEHERRRQAGGNDRKCRRTIETV